MYVDLNVAMSLSRAYIHLYIYILSPYLLRLRFSVIENFPPQVSHLPLVASMKGWFRAIGLDSGLWLAMAAATTTTILQPRVIHNITDS